MSSQRINPRKQRMPAFVIGLVSLCVVMLSAILITNPGAATASVGAPSTPSVCTNSNPYDATAQALNACNEVAYPQTGTSAVAIPEVSIQASDQRVHHLGQHRA